MLSLGSCRLHGFDGDRRGTSAAYLIPLFSHLCVLCGCLLNELACFSLETADLFFFEDAVSSLRLFFFFFSELPVDGLEQFRNFLLFTSISLYVEQPLVIILSVSLWPFSGANKGTSFGYPRSVASIIRLF